MTTSADQPMYFYLFGLCCIAVFCFDSFPMVIFSWLSQSHRWLTINPCNPVIKTSPPSAGSMGSIPGQGVKIPPHALQPNNQNTKNRSSIVINSIKSLKRGHIKKKKTLKNKITNDKNSLITSDSHWKSCSWKSTIATMNYLKSIPCFYTSSSWILCCCDIGIKAGSMVLKHLFTGQQWRNRHGEYTYGHGEREEGGEMYWKSNMDAYITVCKIDSQWKFAVWFWKLSQRLPINLEGWGREGDGRKFQKGGDICIPMADSCWGLTGDSKVL